MNDHRQAMAGILAIANHTTLWRSVGANPRTAVMNIQTYHAEYSIRKIMQT